MSATVRPGLSEGVLENPPAKSDAAAGRDNFRLGLCASPAGGHRKGTVFLPGRRAKCDGSPSAARRGANETVVPTCRGDFLQVVSGMCPDFFSDFCPGMPSALPSAPSARRGEECRFRFKPGKGRRRARHVKVPPSVNDAAAEGFFPLRPCLCRCGSGAEATAQIRKKTIQSVRQGQTRAASGSGLAPFCAFSPGLTIRPCPAFVATPHP